MNFQKRARQVWKQRIICSSSIRGASTHLPTHGYAATREAAMAAFANRLAAGVVQLKPKTEVEAPP